MVNLDAFFANEQITTLSSDTKCALIVNPKTLFASSDGSVVAELIHRVATNAFGKAPEGKSSDEMRTHLEKIARVAVLYHGDEKNEITGFASAGIFPDDHLMYLNRIAVDRCGHGAGIGKILFETLEAHIALPHCALTTQNPVVFNLMKKRYARIFPSPNENVVPPRLRDLGTRLLQDRYKTFDPCAFTITDLYDECMYLRIPESRDPEVNRWFEITLGIVDGRTRNGFLFIAEDRI